MKFDKVPEGAKRWSDNGAPMIVVRPVEGDTVKFMGFLISENATLTIVDENGGDPTPLESGDITVRPEDVEELD